MYNILIKKVTVVSGSYSETKCEMASLITRVDSVHHVVDGRYDRADVYCWWCCTVVVCFVRYGFNSDGFKTVLNRLYTRDKEPVGRQCLCC